MFARSRQFLRSAAVPAGATAAVAVIAVSGTGCGTASGSNNTVPKTIVLHDNANGRTVSVRVGENLELILASSYWNVAGSSAPRVLRQDGATSLLPRPSSCPHIPGLGCTPERTTFKALTSGTAVISARRTSCGEAMRCFGPGHPTRFTLKVIVTAG